MLMVLGDTVTVPAPQHVPLTTGAAPGAVPGGQGWGRSVWSLRRERLRVAGGSAAGATLCWLRPDGR